MASPTKIIGTSSTAQPRGVTGLGQSAQRIEQPADDPSNPARNDKRPMARPQVLPIGDTPECADIRQQLLPPSEDRVATQTSSKSRVMWAPGKANLIESLNMAANEPGLAQLEPDIERIGSPPGGVGDLEPVIKAVEADPRGGSFDFISWKNSHPYATKGYIGGVDYPDVPMIAPKGEGTRTIKVRTSSSDTSSFLNKVRQKYNGEVLKASETGDPGSNILIDWGFVVPLMTEPEFVSVAVMDTKGWSAPPPAYRQTPIYPEVPDHDCPMNEDSTTVPPDTPGDGDGGDDESGGGGSNGGSSGGDPTGSTSVVSSSGMVSSGFLTEGVGLVVVAGAALVVGSAVSSSS